MQIPTVGNDEWSVRVGVRSTAVWWRDGDCVAVLLHGGGMVTVTGRCNLQYSYILVYQVCEYCCMVA